MKKGTSKKNSYSAKALCCFRSHKNKDQNAEHQMVDQRSDSYDLNQSMLSDDHLNTNLGEVLGEGESGDMSGSGGFQNPTSLSENFNLNIDVNSSPRTSPIISHESSPKEISDFNENFEVVPVAGLVPEDRNAPQDQDAGSIEDICEEEKDDEKESADNAAKDAASDAASDVINSPVNSENNSQDSSEDEIKALKNIELEIDMDLAERESQDDNQYNNQDELIEELKEELDVRAEKASNNEDEGQVSSQEGLLPCSDVKLELVDGRNAHSESDLDALRKAVDKKDNDNHSDSDSDSILANNGSRADTPIPALSELEKSVTSPKEDVLSPRTFEATRESSLSKSRSNNSFEENML